jgi:uncharacterized protein (TIGR02118 family)
MIKLTFCLTRLPHLTREGFQNYWFNTHGPLVRSVGEVLGIRRYVQMHSLPDALSEPLRASRGGPAAYDGVAELWYDSLEDLGARLQDPAAREAGARLLEDEKRFIDLPRSPLWWGQERPVIAG